MQVKKRNGEIVPFDPNKVRRWVQWSVLGLKDQIDKEYYILNTTIERLNDLVTTEEIHETMISVCLDKEDIEYSRIASKLEMATIYKNQENLLGIYKPQTQSFTDFLEVMESEGYWKGEWLDNIITNEDMDRINEVYIELEATELEYWTVKQWTDKYSLKRKEEAIETPAQGCLAIALAYHGVTELAFDVARDLIYAKLNLPTPALNGCRNGNFNSISCCLVQGGDSVESMEVSDAIASTMTSKKAGIGIFLDTRSKGDPVKNGAVSHLGKAPLYATIEKLVKKYTQETRGGSATVSFRALDPDIEDLMLLKTQKIDASRRIDKLDYSFVYNDMFVKAVLNNDDWYLFSKYWAPQLHDQFHAENYEDLVRQALRDGTPHKKIKAIDVLESFIKARGETGRIYCLNVTSANLHTPFTDTINQSNLCLEIALPTKSYIDLNDLVEKEKSVGETAFCSLAALNVANITLEEYAEVAERALRTVDRMIELAPMMQKSMRESLLRRRSVGIGITGAASYLYKNGFDYDGSKDSIEFLEDLAERHYYHLLKASQKMAEEEGYEITGVDLNWLPIDTKVSDREPLLDWEPLRGKQRKHSVLVAHMPTESSAVFSSATNGLYPSRERVVYKQARKGVVQFISQYFINKLPAWGVDMIPYYAVVQGYTDQAISADYYTDYTKFDNKKVPMERFVEWFIRQALAGIKTAYYENFNDGSGEDLNESTSDCTSCKL